MVSIGPNIQHYDFSHRWIDLCKLDSCRGKPQPPKVEERKTSLIGILQTKQEFSKTMKIIELARARDFLQTPSYYGNHTLFVTDDKNIPDAFIESLDYDSARKFINSYILKGTTSIQYLLANGDTIYTTVDETAPLLSIVSITQRQPYKAYDQHRIQQPAEILKGDITINKVGKVISEIPVDNGMIIVMDNIASRR
jgi:hypothetical protein